MKIRYECAKCGDISDDIVMLREDNSWIPHCINCYNELVLNKGGKE